MCVHIPHAVDSSAKHCKLGGLKGRLTYTSAAILLAYQNPGPCYQSEKSVQKKQTWEPHEREHVVFVILGLGYFTQYNIF